VKNVFVILAFHAHEPTWDLPQRLLENIDDVYLKQSLHDENWLLRRTAEGRDMYGQLIDFAHALQCPVSLEITNELLCQMAVMMPETYNNLIKAYANTIIYPVYGYAHHTHVALLTEEEIEDEIRLNREYIHEIVKAPRPKYPGLFPIECSLDARKLDALKKSDIKWVVFPNFDRDKTIYSVDGDLNESHDPFLIGQDIIALPRHFPVSQYIWRPITKWKTDGVRSQGYNLGRYWVLPEEYRERKFVRAPITRDEAIEEYTNVLKNALDDAPDNGLIFYIQDLELMDFGDEALDIMQNAWLSIRADNQVSVSFVTPDEYIDRIVIPNFNELKHVKFHQVSWAPEIRLVLRYDGHYPPLEAESYRGIDSTREIFRTSPFIFWEPGRYLSKLANFFLSVFAIEPRVSLNAGQMLEFGYDFGKMPLHDQIVLHSRIIKRACNWGWFPNEGLQKRPFLHGYRLTDLLINEFDEMDDHHQLIQNYTPLESSCFFGLDRILEILIDTRCSYLTEAIVKLSMRMGWEYEEAFGELNVAQQWRQEGRKAAFRAQSHNERLRFASSGRFLSEMRRLLVSTRDYCRSVFISIDHIQRVWIKAGNTDSVLTTMYDSLYRLYPPKFPEILASTLSEDELRLLKNPELL